MFEYTSGDGYSDRYFWRLPVSAGICWNSMYLKKGYNPFLPQISNSSLIAFLTFNVL
jgi:hypothetical protein